MKQLGRVLQGDGQEFRTVFSVQLNRRLRPCRSIIAGYFLECSVHGDFLAVRSTQDHGFQVLFFWSWSLRSTVQSGNILNYLFKIESEYACAQSHCFFWSKRSEGEMVKLNSVMRVESISLRSKCQAGTKGRALKHSHEGRLVTFEESDEFLAALPDVLMVQ